MTPYMCAHCTAIDLGQGQEGVTHAMNQVLCHLVSIDGFSNPHLAVTESKSPLNTSQMEIGIIILIGIYLTTALIHLCGRLHAKWRIRYLSKVEQ